eukprot:SAG11_NODE_1363_length_5110_cov_7.005588_6_plen_107_part_00
MGGVLDIPIGDVRLYSPYRGTAHRDSTILPTDTAHTAGTAVRPIGFRRTAVLPIVFWGTFTGTARTAGTAVPPMRICGTFKEFLRTYRSICFIGDLATYSCTSYGA